jgi:hypothetical protein
MHANIRTTCPVQWELCTHSGFRSQTPYHRSVSFASVALQLTLFALLASALSFASPVGAGILTKSLTPAQIREHLLPASQWHPFPAIGERTEWTALPQDVRSAYIREAGNFLHCSWPELKATEFLEFVRSGNRSGYQTVSFARRERLATLVLAECIEGKGRFKDDIVNGIWAICEESYWGVPAHVGMQHHGPGLPDVSEPTVDLFAAETGSLLAWTRYLLRDSLDTVSPLLAERISYEVGHRINTPSLTRDDFWWMGLSRSVNNWTPWICSNWLACVLILEQDQDRRAQSVYKVIECLDRFLAEYADDGGCDEGAHYWERAGASLFDCLELLRSATNGYVDVFSHPRIREIGRFIVRMHIHGRWFVNFADGNATLQPDAPLIYRYGKAIGDPDMMAFAALIARDQELDRKMLPGQFGVLGRSLPGLFSLGNILRTTPADPCIRDSWLPGIQVMAARSATASAKGLFIAAQGGNNGVNHNHNDIGNFIVYHDGEPVIIDVGVETYTAKTFSNDRYSIWTMQSAYHNCPTINGVMQKDGKEYAAHDVQYNASDHRASLSMDISHAYPPEAGVNSWRRTVTLEREKAVVVRDSYSLQAVHDETYFTFMTCREPQLDVQGTVRLASSPRDNTPIDILYDTRALSARTDTIDISDPQLQASWGTRIWRVVLSVKGTRLNNECLVRIRATK